MAINNNTVIENGLKKLRAIKDKEILYILESTCWDLLSKTDVPVVTHNLWDSIGCGVYRDGVLLKVFYPPKKAVEPRTNIYDTPSENRSYWGREELEDTITNPPASVLSNKGWTLYYVAAMPYSQAVDERVNVLQDEVVKYVFESHVMRLKL